MKKTEEGVLLLCCKLGDPGCRPLTMAQFRQLGLRVRAYGLSGDPLSELSSSDLCRLGYTDEEAVKIVRLLDRQDLLERYLSEAERQGIAPITRVSDVYPARVSAHKKHSATPVLFAKGDLSLLSGPCIAVVGSRVIHEENRTFAKAAGELTAREGFTLVSGGAVGADSTAQRACLEAGGRCIICVPDELTQYEYTDRILYLSEGGYELPFSTPRALCRNALIHMLGEKTIAAQCTYGKGGTWQGCVENLKHGWSELYVFDDGSEGSSALIERGASGVKRLRSLTELSPAQTGMF